MSRVKFIMLILGILGIFVGIIGIGDTIKIMGDDFVSLDTVKKDSMEIGDLVKGNIELAYDQVAIAKSSRSYGFIPMGSSETPYYLVAINDHFGVLSVGDKNVQSKLDTLADKTWDRIDGKTTALPTPVEVTTKVVAMPDKVKQYLHDYCKEWGMSEDDYLQFVDDSCVINYVQYDSMKMIPFIGFGAGALFIIIFIIMLVKGPKGSINRTTFVGEQPPYGGMQNTSAPSAPTEPVQDSQDYMDSVDTTNYKDF